MGTASYVRFLCHSVAFTLDFVCRLQTFKRALRCFAGFGARRVRVENVAMFSVNYVPLSTYCTPCPRKNQATLIFSITLQRVEIFLQFLMHLLQ